ncbi:MAG TPA: NAD(P)-dependent oxidoreductase [Actinocatenispora sp.]
MHGLAGLGDGAERRVASAHPAWRCTDGPPPADAGCQVLVAGRPTYELLPESRVVVLAVPSTSDTAGLFGPAEIATLPSPAVLVNVARAALVDEAALYERLRTGEISAGLDVWWTEATGDGPYAPVAASRLPFHELPNVVLSPHRGGGFSLPEVRGLRLAYVERLLAGLA